MHILEKEARLFWISAQRVRLTPPDTPADDDLTEALDDLTTIHLMTESPLLAVRCAEVLDREDRRCAI